MIFQVHLLGFSYLFQKLYDSGFLVMNAEIGLMSCRR